MLTPINLCMIDEIQLYMVPNARKPRNHRGTYALPLLCGYIVVFIPTIYV